MKTEPITTVMTTDVVSIDRDQPLSEAYQALHGAGYHHIPVLEDDRPIGMISSTDILKLAYDVDGNDDRLLRSMLDHQFTIDDAMTPDLITLSDTATVQDAADVLSREKIHSIVIVDVEGNLVGIVTTTDLIKYLRDL